MMTFEYVARTFRTAIEYGIAVIAYKFPDPGHALIASAFVRKSTDKNRPVCQNGTVIVLFRPGIAFLISPTNAYL